MGPVSDVEPVFPLTTSDDIDNFFSLTERRPGGDSDLAGVNVTTSDFLSQTQNVTPDVGGDNNEIEIPVIIETVNETPDSENFISDFQFSDHPASSFGKLKLDSGDQLDDNRPIVSSLTEQQSNDNEGDTSPPPPPQSLGNQGISDSLIIDLNEPEHRESHPSEYLHASYERARKNW